MTLRRKRGGLRRTPLRRVPLAAAKHEREERERQRTRAKRAKRAAARTERDERRAADEELLAASRELVLLRARGRCARCGRRPGRHRRLEVHHIVPRGRAPRWPGLHLPSNLVALCAGPGGVSRRDPPPRGAGLAALDPSSSAVRHVEPNRMSGHLSRRDVLEYLRLHGPSTVAEIATHYDVSEHVAGAVVSGAALGGVIEYAGESRGARSLYRLPRTGNVEPAAPAAQAEGGC